MDPITTLVLVIVLFALIVGGALFVFRPRARVEQGPGASLKGDATHTPTPGIKMEGVTAQSGRDQTTVNQNVPGPGNIFTGTGDIHIIQPPAIKTDEQRGGVNATNSTFQGNTIIGGNQYNYATTPTPASPLHSIPAPPADFTGRVHEVEQLLAHLTAGTSPAIIGLSGLGDFGLAFRTNLDQVFIVRPPGSASEK